jgi:hypothetical protein
VNPSTAPSNIPGNLLHSFDSAGDNNDEGGINSSFLLNDNEECQGPFNVDAMLSSEPAEEVRSGRQEMGLIPKGAAPFLSH